MVTVLMSDIRGYSGIAERSDPTQLAAQLNEHRAEMNHAILDEGGTVMQFVGDAVMACFGAPVAARRPRRPRASTAAVAMLERQRALERAVGWRRARRRSGSASGCRPARSRPRCSGRRSGSSTRSSATP